jgi:hypothetical protein
MLQGMVVLLRALTSCAFNNTDEDTGTMWVRCIAAVATLFVGAVRDLLLLLLATMLQGGRSASEVSFRFSGCTFPRRSKGDTCTNQAVRLASARCDGGPHDIYIALIDAILDVQQLCG